MMQTKGKLFVFILQCFTRGRGFKWFIPQNTCCHLLLHFVTPLHVFVLLCVAVHIFVDIYISPCKENCNKMERKLKIEQALRID